MQPRIFFQKVLLACRDGGQGNPRGIFRDLNCLTYKVKNQENTKLCKNMLTFTFPSDRC